MILQKYDFSSKSQLVGCQNSRPKRCLWYCKSTIFQANHNGYIGTLLHIGVVCDTAKVRFFKQITTVSSANSFVWSCLWYCKSTIFQANHNASSALRLTSKLFVILQKYDFSSKSQPKSTSHFKPFCCLWYCKSTIFQANHNTAVIVYNWYWVVCDTAKVRFFKQITTSLKVV